MSEFKDIVIIDNVKYRIDVKDVRLVNKYTKEEITGNTYLEHISVLQLITAVYGNLSTSNKIKYLLDNCDKNDTTNNFNIRDEDTLLLIDFSTKDKYIYKLLEPYNEKHLYDIEYVIEDIKDTGH